ncbi:MAG: hypothetical protein N4A57_04730 [Anaeromicrobium sp.]|uniref:hypothetical protein n=1 Tax=Anaeromicrobium sp. TaxID=1929132 RepID=UPI0025FAB8DA|nr:hypothetical protein [Anaeromicrobium sp.]MCT4593562.1 hypothetical protein [Anaeromicrobium sp.]
MKKRLFQWPHIKAIGFVVGRNIKEFYYDNNNINSMGFGRKVLWKHIYEDSEDWIRVAIFPEDMKNNVYNNTLYEEYSANAIKRIIRLI